MKITIEKVAGKWKVNRKPYDELNSEEKQALNDFIRDAKKSIVIND